MAPKKPQDLRDIIGAAAKGAKKAAKVGLYLNPTNPKGISNDVANMFFAKKELTRIAQGKGTKRDYAEVAATAATFAVPVGKVGKLIKVGKGLTRTSKVATKVVRGTANTAGFIGLDEGVRRGVVGLGNKVKPTATKPKTKPKTKVKPKGK